MVPPGGVRRLSHDRFLTVSLDHLFLGMEIDQAT